MVDPILSSVFARAFPAKPAYAREVEYAGWVPELAMVAVESPGPMRHEPPPAVAWCDIDRLLRRLEGR